MKSESITLGNALCERIEKDVDVFRRPLDEVPAFWLRLGFRFARFLTFPLLRCGSILDDVGSNFDVTSIRPGLRARVGSMVLGGGTYGHRFGIVFETHFINVHLR